MQVRFSGTNMQNTVIPATKPIFGLKTSPTSRMASEPRFGLFDKWKHARQDAENAIIFQAPEGGSIDVLKPDEYKTIAATRPDLIGMLEDLPQPLAQVTREVRFNTPDGVSLYGWHTPPQPGKPTILYVPANAENVGSVQMAVVMSNFLHEGYGFFTFDYRGRGNSEGTPSEESAYQDLKTASQYLEKELDTPLSNQVALGRSLGGAVLSDAAVEVPFRAVVLLSTFTTMRKAVRQIKTKIHSLLKFIPAEFAIKQKFDAINKVGNIQSPTLVIHGDADELLPVEMGRKLFKACQAEQKEMVEMPGGDHNSLLYQPETGSQIAQSITDFLSRTA